MGVDEDDFGLWRRGSASERRARRVCVASRRTSRGRRRSIPKATATHTYSQFDNLRL